MLNGIQLALTIIKFKCEKYKKIIIQNSVKNSFE